MTQPTPSAPRPPYRADYRFGAIAVGLLFIAAIIVLSGQSPFEGLGAMLGGAFGTPDQFARVLSTLVPMTLCA